MNAAQLDHTAKVLAEMLTFKQPSDAVLSAYFREHKKLGRQDRHEIAETAFAALRHYQKISTALRRPHAQPRKAALAALVLGRSTNISQIKDLLDEEETEFLGNLKARKTEFSDGLNTAAELPQWLVEQLQQHWSEEEILAFGRSINQPAPLDIRVNILKGKRDKVLPLLQAESADAEATPYSPWGIRLKNKIALNKHELFLDGTLEVQDEGSQLLALLVGAKRGEIIVDFCAGAGGKTLAVGAQMANKGRIYAFDIAEKRLANLKPRMTRAGLTNIHPERISSEHDSRIARLTGKADRVLVDAPLLRLRHAAPQSRPQIPPVARNRRQTFGAATQHPRCRRQTGQAARQAGLRHLQRIARRKEMQVERFLEEHLEYELLDCAELLAG